jgi:cytochrome d ubiquinol oxidase subunit II
MAREASMAEVLLAVLLVAAILYVVLGGADFGAGIIEGLIGKQARERIDVALAPVWEANHVWLVLIVVIVFVGFPRVYTLLSIHLHIPILFFLLGVVARGSAFTFRHYDPTATLERWYTVVFRASSLLAPLSLGLCVAASASGRLPVAAQHDFYASYIAPWNTPFGWATGLFVCALFAYEGAALLAAEHPREAAPLPYLRAARNAQWTAIVSGALVLAIAWFEQLPFWTALIRSPFALTAIAAASCLIVVVAYAFHAGRPWLARLAMGGQAACVLSGFLLAQFPVLLQTQAGPLTYRQLAAPDSTLRGLLWAVGVGLLLIGPSLVYLIRTYKHPAAARRY